MSTISEHLGRALSMNRKFFWSAYIRGYWFIFLFVLFHTVTIVAPHYQDHGITWVLLDIAFFIGVSMVFLLYPYARVCQLAIADFIGTGSSTEQTIFVGPVLLVFLLEIIAYVLTLVLMPVLAIGGMLYLYFVTNNPNNQESCAQ